MIKCSILSAILTDLRASIQIYLLLYSSQKSRLVCDRHFFFFFLLYLTLYLYLILTFTLTIIALLTRSLFPDKAAWYGEAHVMIGQRIQLEQTVHMLTVLKAVMLGFPVHV